MQERNPDGASRNKTEQKANPHPLSRKRLSKYFFKLLVLFSNSRKARAEGRLLHELELCQRVIKKLELENYFLRREIDRFRAEVESKPSANFHSGSMPQRQEKETHYFSSHMIPHPYCNNTNLVEEHCWIPSQVLRLQSIGSDPVDQSSIQSNFREPVNQNNSNCFNE